VKEDLEEETQEKEIGTIAIIQEEKVLKEVLVPQDILVEKIMEEAEKQADLAQEIQEGEIVGLDKFIW
jgi:hypothetical protein